MSYCNNTDSHYVDSIDVNSHYVDKWSFSITLLNVMSSFASNSYIVSLSSE